MSRWRHIVQNIRLQWTQTPSSSIESTPTTITADVRAQRLTASGALQVLAATIPLRIVRVRCSGGGIQTEITGAGPLVPSRGRPDVSCLGEFAVPVRAPSTSTGVGRWGRVGGDIRHGRSGNTAAALSLRCRGAGSARKAHAACASGWGPGTMRTTRGPSQAE